VTMHGERTGGGAAGSAPGGDTAPSRCSRCTKCGGSELRSHRRTVRARFGGQDVRLDVASDECLRCGEIHYGEIGFGAGGAR
jgi:YgiT-type zinc finger domain-containing protein